MRLLLTPLAVAALLAVPATAQAAYPHVVAPGESLSSVAVADGLSVAQLAAANGLSPTAQLVAGTTLMIPPRTAAASGSSRIVFASATSTSSTAPSSGDGDHDADDPSSAPATTVAGPGSYVVQRGDTLSAIAARAGMSVGQLAAINNLNPNGILFAGSVLRLSSSATTGSTFVTGTTAMSQPVGVAAQGSPGGPPYTTQEFVSPAQVGSIAAANGVPPALAEAVAYMESGFNNALTSSSDARGVMQITPGTWSWISQTLAGSTPLAPASASSNVLAGVLLLRSLLQATGGNQAQTVAGYYQGLPSVLKIGLYPGTQQYVNDVLALEPKFGG